MRDWIIKKLGGFTSKEFGEQTLEWSALCTEQRKDMLATIQELQALVPVSAVLQKEESSMFTEDGFIKEVDLTFARPKKKRGRPRKALKIYPVLGNPTLADSETGETQEIRKNPDGSLAVRYVGKKRKG